MDPTVFMKPDAKRKPEPRKEAGPSNSGMARQKQATKPTEVKNEDVDFDSLSNSDKQCWKYVSENYSGAQAPDAWAKYHANESGLPEEGLRSAANRFRSDLAKENGNIDKVHKWPWWSAARNWNPDSGIWGGKQWKGESKSILGNGAPFKFNPDMVESVRNKFY